MLCTALASYARRCNRASDLESRGPTAWFHQTGRVHRASRGPTAWFDQTGRVHRASRGPTAWFDQTGRVHQAKRCCLHAAVGCPLHRPPGSARHDSASTRWCLIRCNKMNITLYVTVDAEAAPTDSMCCPQYIIHVFCYTFLCWKCLPRHVICISIGVCCPHNAVSSFNYNGLS